MENKGISNKDSHSGDGPSSHETLHIIDYNSDESIYDSPSQFSSNVIQIAPLDLFYPLQLPHSTISSTFHDMDESSRIENHSLKTLEQPHLHYSDIPTQNIEKQLYYYSEEELPHKRSISSDFHKKQYSLSTNNDDPKIQTYRIHRSPFMEFVMPQTKRGRILRFISFSLIFLLFAFIINMIIFGVGLYMASHCSFYPEKIILVDLCNSSNIPIYIEGYMYSPSFVSVSLDYIHLDVFVPSMSKTIPIFSSTFTNWTLRGIDGITKINIASILKLDVNYPFPESLVLKSDDQLNYTLTMTFVLPLNVFWIPYHYKGEYSSPPYQFVQNDQPSNYTLQSLELIDSNNTDALGLRFGILYESVPSRSMSVSIPHLNGMVILADGKELPLVSLSTAPFSMKANQSGIPLSFDAALTGENVVAAHTLLGKYFSNDSNVNILIKFPSSSPDQYCFLQSWLGSQKGFQYTLPLNQEDQDPQSITSNKASSMSFDDILVSSQSFESDSHSDKDLFRPFNDFTVAKDPLIKVQFTKITDTASSYLHEATNNASDAFFPVIHIKVLVHKNIIVPYLPKTFKFNVQTSLPAILFKSYILWTSNTLREAIVFHLKLDESETLDCDYLVIGIQLCILDLGNIVAAIQNYMGWPIYLPTWLGDSMIYINQNINELVLTGLTIDQDKKHKFTNTISRLLSFFALHIDISPDSSDFGSLSIYADSRNATEGIVIYKPKNSVVVPEHSDFIAYHSISLKIDSTLSNATMDMEWTPPKDIKIYPDIFNIISISWNGIQTDLLIQSKSEEIHWNVAQLRIPSGSLFISMLDGPLLKRIYSNESVKIMLDLPVIALGEKLSKDSSGHRSKIGSGSSINIFDLTKQYEDIDKMTLCVIQDKSILTYPLSLSSMLTSNSSSDTATRLILDTFRIYQLEYLAWEFDIIHFLLLFDIARYDIGQEASIFPFLNGSQFNLSVSLPLIDVCFGYYTQKTIYSSKTNDGLLFRTIIPRIKVEATLSEQGLHGLIIDSHIYKMLYDEHDKEYIEEEPKEEKLFRLPIVVANFQINRLIELIDDLSRGNGDGYIGPFIPKNYAIPQLIDRPVFQATRLALESRSMISKAINVLLEERFRYKLSNAPKLPKQLLESLDSISYDNIFGKLADKPLAVSIRVSSELPDLAITLKLSLPDELYHPATMPLAGWRHRKDMEIIRKQRERISFFLMNFKWPSIFICLSKGQECVSGIYISGGHFCINTANGPEFLTTYPKYISDSFVFKFTFTMWNMTDAYGQSRFITESSFYRPYVHRLVSILTSPDIHENDQYFSNFYIRGVVDTNATSIKAESIDDQDRSKNYFYEQIVGHNSATDIVHEHQGNRVLPISTENMHRFCRLIRDMFFPEKNETYLINEASRATKFYAMVRPHNETGNGAHIELPCLLPGACPDTDSIKYTKDTLLSIKVTLFLYWKSISQSVSGVFSQMLKVLQLGKYPKDVFVSFSFDNAIKFAIQYTGIPFLDITVKPFRFASNIGVFRYEMDRLGTRPNGDWVNYHIYPDVAFGDINMIKNQLDPYFIYSDFPSSSVDTRGSYKPMMVKSMNPCINLEPENWTSIKTFNYTEDKVSERSYNVTKQKNYTTMSCSNTGGCSITRKKVVEKLIKTYPEDRNTGDIVFMNYENSNDTYNVTLHESKIDGCSFRPFHRPSSSALTTDHEKNPELIGILLSALSPELFSIEGVPDPKTFGAEGEMELLSTEKTKLDLAMPFFFNNTLSNIDISLVNDDDYGITRDNFTVQVYYKDVQVASMTLEESTFYFGKVTHSRLICSVDTSTNDPEKRYKIYEYITAFFLRQEIEVRIKLILGTAMSYGMSLKLGPRYEEPGQVKFTAADFSGNPKRFPNPVMSYVITNAIPFYMKWYLYDLDVDVCCTGRYHQIMLDPRYKNTLLPFAKGYNINGFGGRTLKINTDIFNSKVDCKSDNLFDHWGDDYTPSQKYVDCFHNPGGTDYPFLVLKPARNNSVVEGVVDMEMRLKNTYQVQELGLDAVYPDNFLYPNNPKGLCLNVTGNIVIGISSERNDTPFLVDIHLHIPYTMGGEADPCMTYMSCWPNRPILPKVNISWTKLTNLNVPPTRFIFEKAIGLKDDHNISINHAFKIDIHDISDIDNITFITIDDMNSTANNTLITPKLPIVNTIISDFFEIGIFSLSNVKDGAVFYEDKNINTGEYRNIIKNIQGNDVKKVISTSLDRRLVPPQEHDSSEFKSRLLKFFTELKDITANYFMRYIKAMRRISGPDPINLADMPWISESNDNALWVSRFPLNNVVFKQVYRSAGDFDSWYDTEHGHLPDIWGLLDYSVNTDQPFMISFKFIPNFYERFLSCALSPKFSIHFVPVDERIPADPLKEIRNGFCIEWNFGHSPVNYTILSEKSRWILHWNNEEIPCWPRSVCRQEPIPDSYFVPNINTPERIINVTMEYIPQQSALFINTIVMHKEIKNPIRAKFPIQLTQDYNFTLANLRLALNDLDAQIREFDFRYVGPYIKGAKLYHHHRNPGHIGESRRYYLEIRDACDSSFFYPFKYYSFKLYITPKSSSHIGEYSYLVILDDDIDPSSLESNEKYKITYPNTNIYGDHDSAMHFNFTSDHYGYHYLKLCMKPKPNNNLLLDSLEEICTDMIDHIYIMPPPYADVDYT